MDGAERYFDLHVVPRYREYLATEDALSAAVESGDMEALEVAREDVMRAAMTACINMHQMGDAAATSRPSWLPPDKHNPSAAREWVDQQHCRMARGSPARELGLLSDVADAFKHFELDRPRGKNTRREVKSDKATVATATGYGQLGFGEGKFGGVEQVVVTLLDGRQRALSLILQNAIDAWRSALGRPLPPFGE